jgi:RimJ/RimL family protein N-acetyltransferase
MLSEWLVRPHVAEWWDDRVSLDEIRADYEPVIRGDPALQCYIANLDGTPFGFIQSYTPALHHDDGWWLDEHDPTVRGIDQFIADASLLDRGLGTAMIAAFVAHVFSDPSVSRIQTDPHPTNGRAIRCYEKVGFIPHGVSQTPDGPALLMYRDRAPADSK